MGTRKGPAWHTTCEALDQWIAEHGTMPTKRQLAAESGYGHDTAARVLNHYIKHDLAARQVVRWLAYGRRKITRTVESSSGDTQTVTTDAPAGAILRSAALLMDTAVPDPDEALVRLPGARFMWGDSPEDRRPAEQGDGDTANGDAGDGDAGDGEPQDG